MSDLARCLDTMARRDIDVMILGREANARTVADTMRLWLAGTRAFSPSCVVVRDGATVHVLANSDDAVPESFPVDRLFGITWNPEKLAAALAGIPGVSTARRVAVDGMSPGMRALLHSVAPRADLVDAAVVISEVWRHPSPERAAGVASASRVARDVLDTMAAALAPGARPRTLRGVAAQRSAALGVTTPAFEAVATPLDDHTSTWLPPERLLDEGEVVVLRAGVVRNGWEASAARTFVVGTPSVATDAPRGWDALVDAFRPGTAVAELRARDAVVFGLGHGVEPWDDDLVLAAGHTCSVQLDDVNALRQDVLLVTDGAPHVLTD